MNQPKGSQDTTVHTSLIWLKFVGFYSKLESWPWKWSQGNQIIISCKACSNEVSLQAWWKSAIPFKRYCIQETVMLMLTGSGPKTIFPPPPVVGGHNLINDEVNPKQHALAQVFLKTFCSLHCLRTAKMLKLEKRHNSVKNTCNFIKPFSSHPLRPNYLSDFMIWA